MWAPDHDLTIIRSSQNFLRTQQKSVAQHQAYVPVGHSALADSAPSLADSLTSIHKLFVPMRYQAWYELHLSHRIVAARVHSVYVAPEKSLQAAFMQLERLGDTA